MMRWVVRLGLLVGALVVVLTLAVAWSGPDGSLRGAVDGALRDVALAGARAPIGVRVHVGPGPDVVTVDERPPETLGGTHASGFGYNAGFLTLGVRTYANSLRDTLVTLLGVRHDQLDADPSLESLIVDASAERYVGLVPSVAHDELVEQLEDTIVGALCTAYDLSLEASTRSVTVSVLRPAPDFDQKTVYEPGPGGPNYIHGQHDRIRVNGAFPWNIEHVLRNYADVRLVEGLDPDGRYTFRVEFDPEIEGDLVRALEEQAGLLLRDETRELPHFVVTGVAASRIDG